MSMKNIDVICTMFEVFDKQLDINNNRNNYHIPIDNYILKALWGMCKDKKLTVDMFPKRDTNRKDESDKFEKTAFDRVKPWSQWDKDDYINFRKGFKKILKLYCEMDCELEWEYSAWIKEKQKSSKNKQRACEKEIVCKLKHENA